MNELRKPRRGDIIIGKQTESLIIIGERNGHYHCICDRNNNGYSIETCSIKLVNVIDPFWLRGRDSVYTLDQDKDEVYLSDFDTDSDSLMVVVAEVFSGQHDLWIK